jgi:hypothetical protein
MLRRKSNLDLALGELLVGWPESLGRRFKLTLEALAYDADLHRAELAITVLGLAHANHGRHVE